MTEKHDILSRIEEQREQMSSKQQQLADYILKNYKTAAFQNSTKLAKLAGVSGSTVIRFAEELGYDGFPGMQAALHRIVQMEITTVDAFLSANAGSSEQMQEKGGFFHPCIQSFHRAEKSISKDSIESAAKLLAEARNIYIIGFLGSSFLAEHISYVLSRIRKNVFRIHTNALFHLIPEDGWEQDVALVYAFPRFPSMTATYTKYFHAHGTPIICITTAHRNHISELANISIGIDLEYRTYVDHLTPVLYVSEVLAKKVSKLSPEASVKQLERFEKFTQDIHAFSS